MTSSEARSGIPDWAGAAVLLGAVFAPWATIAAIAAVSHSALLRGLAVVAVLFALTLLALVAPFGNYRRTRALWCLIPFAGWVYAADMAWHCGIGLARISRRIRLTDPTDSHVTTLGGPSA